MPVFKNDFVILTPTDMLTKDDTWINHSDLVSKFEDIFIASENSMLRDQMNNYLRSILDKNYTRKDYLIAVNRTIQQFPDVIDHYIKFKEDHGDEAIRWSTEKVQFSDILYVQQYGELSKLLSTHSEYYQCNDSTAEGTKKRIEYLKDIIVNNGGHKIFYINGNPIRKEDDLHILFRLTWCNTSADVSREVDDGRGPADFKISRGNRDKTIVEFKLASNSHLKKNLRKQVGVYKKASDAETGFYVILFFTENEYDRAISILDELKLADSPSVYLIDARKDNKPTGSKA